MKRLSGDQPAKYLPVLAAVLALELIVRFASGNATKTALDWAGTVRFAVVFLFIVVAMLLRWRRSRTRS